MSGIRFENVTKEYKSGVKAVDALNLNIEDGEFVVLLGPSGCGKSTTLFMLAGLEELTDGEIYIDDICVNGFPPKARDVSVVFQDYALFPNLNVYDNIGFGLTVRRVNKKEKDEKVRYAAKLLELTEYLDRKPNQLSGGQKQRVAIGRSIVREASVFLFDEPLSNLDVKLRVQMRSELLELYHLLKATMIYVTHDQSEAMALATKLVIMKEGVIQQVGAPGEVYNSPQNLFVATFIGAPKMNILDITLCFKGDKTYAKLADESMLRIAKNQAKELRSKKSDGAKLYMGIRPEAVSLVQQAGEGTLKGEVNLVEMLGIEKNVYFTATGTSMVANVETEEDIPHGENYFLPNMGKALFFDYESEELIVSYV